MEDIVVFFFYCSRENMNQWIQCNNNNKRILTKCSEILSDDENFLAGEQIALESVWFTFGQDLLAKFGWSSVRDDVAVCSHSDMDWIMLQNSHDIKKEWFELRNWEIESNATAWAAAGRGDDEWQLNPTSTEALGQVQVESPCNICPIAALPSILQS